MKEITIKVNIPEDLEDIVKIRELDLSLAVSRFLKKKMLKIAEVEAIASKSKLSEKKAAQIAREISLTLSRKYENLYKKIKG